MTLLMLVSAMITIALEDEHPAVRATAAVLWPLILPVDVAVRLYHRFR